MAITSLSCRPPVRRLTPATQTDHELLEQAIVAHDAGDHRASLGLTLRHLFASLELGDPWAKPVSFVQGSSRVTMQVDDDHIEVRVPLVELAEDSLVTAALRFLLSRVSGSGQLYQPQVEGEKVYLVYRDRLTRLHPYKVREVLRQMPFDADRYDDWMVAEFRCAPLEREPLEELTAEERRAAHEIWLLHWTEVEELFKEAQRRRSMWFLNELSAYAVYRLRHALPITGHVWCRIDDAADTFNDTQIDPSQREAALIKCVRQMRDVSPDELDGSLGHGHYALAPSAEGTTAILDNHIGDGEYIDTINRLHNGGRYLESALALIGTYTYLLARCSWPPELERRLLEGLTLADGKSWREASATLLQHRHSVLDDEVSQGDEESQGDNQ